MHMPRVSVLAVWGLIGLALAACSPRISQRIEEARAALETARSAGAQERSPQEFQKAERLLKESEALVAAGDTVSLLEAERRTLVAEVEARSAVATSRLRTDLEKVQAEALAAKQESTRVRTDVERLRAQAQAELNRLQGQIRATEEVARAAQARAERAEVRGLELRLQPVGPAVAPAAQPPTTIRYVVKRGDTLRRIAARPEIYGDVGQWQRIYEANRSTIGRDRKVKTGQILIIPKP